MKRTHLLGAVSLALLASGFSPLPAAACGGFFCSASQPVNQQAERIIFASQADGSVTAVIQIQYQGPSEEFAWMLPVDGDPEVGVSSDTVFARLQQATNPSYFLSTRTEGTCRDDRIQLITSESGSDSAGGLSSGGQAGGVTVLSQGSVGPYDHVTIALDPSQPDLTDVAIAWLQDNGYDVPSLGADVLRPYLEAGMNLLAFRLTKGSDVGTIRPVRLTFGQGLPAIPLRPTAVAADPNMGIMVWVLGEHRAVPANYRSLELNDALINWLNPGPTYNDVVTRAANEARGQGFVTEHAGPARELAERLWGLGDAEIWRAIRTDDWAGREQELLDRLFFLSGADGMNELLAKHFNLPSSISQSDFSRCPSCYYEQLDVSGVDTEELFAEVQRDVVDPIVETQELFLNTRTSTRLYTTMSAEEMTVDPIFDFNPDLPDVSNQHQADRIIECSRSVDRADAPWRVELESGEVIRGRGLDWPFSPDTEAMPANAVVRRVGSEGGGAVVVDNVATIQRALREHNQTIPGPGGCALTGDDRSSNLTLWAGLGLFFALRRRRR